MQVVLTSDRVKIKIDGKPQTFIKGDVITVDEKKGRSLIQLGAATAAPEPQKIVPPVEDEPVVDEVESDLVDQIEG